MSTFCCSSSEMISTYKDASMMEGMRKNFYSELSSGFKYGFITFSALSSRLYVQKKHGKSTCLMKGGGEGGWGLFRYDVMDTCPTKRGLCPSKNRFDCIT